MKHILVSCDHDDRSGAAMPYARLFTNKFGAALTVIHAGDARTVVQTAREVGADLIIIATRGLHGWRRTLLGSIALDVIHGYDGSVLVIEPPETPAAVTPKISRILCPVNMTEVARESVRVASSMAARFAAQLVIVHVVEDGHTTYDSGRSLRKWLANDAKPDVAWREIVMRGGAAERVLDCAEDLDADLLVVGAQHKFLRDATVIGSTTERLLRFAKCPVLSIIRENRAQENDGELADVVSTARACS
jgi:nucleotide-binding universal stress UspA family protein